MHPHLKEAREGHASKIRRLSGAHGTVDKPSGNEPTNQEVPNGPQPAIGLSAEGSKPKKNLGKVQGGPQRVGGVGKFAHGGRAKKKGGTHVNVIVGHPGPNAAPAPPMPIVPPGAAMAPPPRPPMPPPMPPGGPGPGMPPPGMGPGIPGMPPRKMGGRAFARGGRAHAHPDAALDRAEIKRIVKPSALKRKDGGRAHFTAGAGSGEGREEKSKAAHGKAHMKGQAV